MVTALSATGVRLIVASSRGILFSHQLPQPASWPRHGGMNTCGGFIPNSPCTAGKAIKGMGRENTGMRSESTAFVNTTGKVLTSVLRNLFPRPQTSSDNHGLITGAIDDGRRENPADPAVHDDIHQIAELPVDHFRVRVFFNLEHIGRIGVGANPTRKGRT